MSIPRLPRPQPFGPLQFDPPTAPLSSLPEAVLQLPCPHPSRTRSPQIGRSDATPLHSRTPRTTSAASSHRPRNSQHLQPTSPTATRMPPHSQRDQSPRQKASPCSGLPQGSFSPRPYLHTPQKAVPDSRNQRPRFVPPPAAIATEVLGCAQAWKRRRNGHSQRRNQRPPTPPAIALIRNWSAGFHPGPCSGAAASHQTACAAATPRGASEVAQVSNAPLPQNSEKSLCLACVQESSRNKPRRSACMAGVGFSHAARRQASGAARGWNNSALVPMNPSKALPQDPADAPPLQGWSVLRRWRLWSIVGPRAGCGALLAGPACAPARRWWPGLGFALDCGGLESGPGAGLQPPEAPEPEPFSALGFSKGRFGVKAGLWMGLVVSVSAVLGLQAQPAGLAPGEVSAVGRGDGL